MQESTSNTNQSSTGVHYDYIIAGAGAAGLSLVMHLIKSGQFRNKSILLVDKDGKKANDRTWCFWEKEPGLFQTIVYKEWNQLNFHSDDFYGELDIHPYTYKLIRGIDFYNYCFETICRQQNITFIQAAVDKIISNEKETCIWIDEKRIEAQYIFNSILFQKPQLKPGQYWLLQHFKGWVIEAKDERFDAASATLMDFRVAQEKGTAFYYVLPFSSNKALIEYTLFSPQLLSQNEYDEALRSYIDNRLKINDYQVCEEEFGCIPMTNYKFPAQENRMINIGTAGGQTKGSSGYTFRFIQKHSAAIVEGLISSNNPLSQVDEKIRHSFYDSILLDVLAKNRKAGSTIFRQLFAKNKASAVLKFLDNETSLAEDISIIKTLPTFPFLKAAFNQLV